jgi:hypothetical protein
VSNGGRLASGNFWQEPNIMPEPHSDLVLQRLSETLRQPVALDPRAREAIMGHVRAVHRSQPWRIRRGQWLFRRGPRGTLSAVSGLALAASIAGILALPVVEPRVEEKKVVQDTLASKLVCDTIRAMRLLHDSALRIGHPQRPERLRLMCDSLLRSDTTDHG